MPEPKRPLKVFLSYASQDKPLVRELSRQLVGEGWIETWQDEKNLLPGQDWRVKIEEAVEEADVVIIVLSQHSVSKEGHVQKELRYAREIALEKPEDSIFLIPLRLEECEVPRGLRFYQWVDYFGEKKNSSYKALVASLKLRYEQKLKAEETEHRRKEQQEREIAKKLAYEKARRNVAEQARRKVEEERLRISTEKAEHESTERAVGRERKENELREKQTREASKEVQPVKSKTSSQIVYWFGGTVALALGITLFSSLQKFSSNPQLAPEYIQTQTISALVQNTVEPISTAIPKSTLTPISTLSPTPLPTEIIDTKGITMRLVPAGEFTMGSEKGEKDEAPTRQVYLDAFYMDIYEVTNTNYKTCVDTGVCEPPYKKRSYSRPDYYEKIEFNNYPVLYVDWKSATNYCQWRGASLPTEAQWEKAARGTDERTYPWGEEIDCTKANYGNCVGDTIPVGSYESGKSPYGIYDLAGNVYELTSDWYSETYYQDAPSLNPLGPDTGQKRVLRGGTWLFADVRSSLRWSIIDSEPPLDDTYIFVGFRCAKKAP